MKGAAPAALLSPEERARQHAAALEAALLEAKVDTACRGQSPGLRVPSNQCASPQADFYGAYTRMGPVDTESAALSFVSVIGCHGCPSVLTLCSGCQVRVWSEVYSSVIEDTKGYVEKKQASTYEELVAEQEQKAEEVCRVLLTQHGHKGIILTFRLHDAPA